MNIMFNTNLVINYVVNKARDYYYSYDKFCERLEHLGFKQNYTAYNYLRLRQSEDDVVYVKDNIMVIIGIYGNTVWQLDAVVKFDLGKEEYSFLVN